MKLYSYVIARDIGFAPNPFWEYCTLAMCTPNYMGIKAKKDDWIIGISSKAQGNKLVYAMQVSDGLHFDTYYRDGRFEKKKPVKDGTWRERCGDNIYFMNLKGEWEQHAPGNFRGAEKMQKDLRHPKVFVAENFYYFGDKSVVIPLEYRELICMRGCKKDHSPEVVELFITWLRNNFSTGVLGNPKDNEEAQSPSCF